MAAVAWEVHPVVADREDAKRPPAISPLTLNPLVLNTRNQPMNKLLRDRKENLLYASLWALLFLAPLGTSAVHTYIDSNYHFDWHVIFHVWKICALFLVAFLIHNFFCAPILVYKRQRVKYVITTIFLLIAFTLVQCSTKPKQEMKMHPDTPPSALAPRPATPDSQPSPLAPRPPRPPFLIADPELFFCISLFLLFGLNLGVKIYFRSERDRKKMQLLKSQNLEHQLAYLKYQINPHFFMNTLNNIHALVDIDPEQAKSTIVELSKMMRYILYEGNNTVIPLQRECDFIKHYVRLMSMRYSDKVKINLDVPLQVSEGQLPPLLLITFVENAFKHGISYQKDSFVNISLTTDSDHIYFSCSNSKAEKQNEEQGGVGLANVRQRLDIIYGDRYVYDIKENDNNYTVALTLPTITNNP